MAAQLETGAPCPALSLPATGGQTVRIPPASKRGLIIFFYPRDNTPGCTTEAKAFSELKSAFDAKGYDLLGISRDSLSSHEKFVEKQSLCVILGSDEDGEACNAFGVWVEKSMYGKKFMGIERSTFTISPDNVITNIWRKVKVKGHAEDVLNSL